MYKVLFGIVVAGTTAFAAFDATNASSVAIGSNEGNHLIRIGNGWHAEILTPSCWVQRSWKYDYSGKPYLKKVRVCA
jgi:hypothetical protein